jgi:hypothetical protein
MPQTIGGSTLRGLVRTPRAQALIVALVSVAVIWWTWGAWSPGPEGHDQQSYVLQADIFARGHWAAPSPPIPAFFQQPHVLVTPVTASKYPPGHALLLALGSLAHFHALVPLLLTGITATLLFMLTARVANPWAAAIAWLTWISMPLVLRFQPSYFSELTTSALLLTAWWCLLQWRATRHRAWLLALAAAVGWGAITRPLTMLALAIPIGVVVLRDAWATRRMTDLALALGVGSLILGVLPLWSARTTGSWRTTPLELYRQQYLPFDKLGFTPDTTPPQQSLQPPMQSVYRLFLLEHRRETQAGLAATVAERARYSAAALFGGMRAPIGLLAVVGLFVAAPAVQFAAASALLLFVAYLPYAFQAGWVVYYLEVAPVAAALAAVGAWWTAERFLRNARRTRVAMLVLACALIVDTARASQAWRHSDRFDAFFARQLLQVPPGKAIVFLRYAPDRPNHIAEVLNSPDLSAKRVWVVHDLGPRNRELERLAPDRATYVFEENQLVRQPGR